MGEREKRGHTFKVRLSDAERVALETRALREGVTVASLVRRLAADDSAAQPLGLSPVIGRRA